MLINKLYISFYAPQGRADSKVFKSVWGLTVQYTTISLIRCQLFNYFPSKVIVEWICLEQRLKFHSSPLSCVIIKLLCCYLRKLAALACYCCLPYLLPLSLPLITTNEFTTLPAERVTQWKGIFLPGTVLGTDTGQTRNFSLSSF